MRQLLGWVLAAGFTVLPLVAVWLSRSGAGRGAARRLRRGDRSRPAGRPQPAPAPQPHEDASPRVPASERALVQRLLAGKLDPSTYRERMTALARREATRQPEDLGPP